MNSDTFPEFSRLIWVMEQLRDPQAGCPWDLQQDFRSIVPYTIEETYELVDAIESGLSENIKDELGDLLFQIVFYAKLGDEKQWFDFEAVANGISEKLIRRHPHVFDRQMNLSSEQLSLNWEKIKQEERDKKGKIDDNSILANITRGLPPLVKATKLQKRCAKAGFDWSNVNDVADKISEELNEVLAELAEEEKDQSAIEEEMGDLLFAVTNLSRHLNVDPERALRIANYKFEKRFRYIEDKLAEAGKSLEESQLDEMESLWVEAKTIK